MPLERAAPGLWLVLAALCLAAVGPAYMNHDAAWYLYMVERWREGASLYRDVVDTNPPLIVWLTAPPVLVSRATGIGAPLLFKLYMFMIAVAAILATERIARRGLPDRTFILVTLVVFVCLPFAKGDFGQREHLAILLTMPYVLAAAVPGRTLGRTAESLIGIAGGIGFAIKPHFLIAWMAVEAAVLWRDGMVSLRRLAAVAAMATFLIYGLAAVLTTPQYFGIADQVRQVYGGLNSSFGVLLRLREVQLWIVALAIIVAVRWPRHERVPLVTFAAATGYLAAALVQFKGWGYQLYPARAMTVLFLGSAAATLVDEVPALIALLRGGRRGLGIVFAAALVISSTRYILEARHPAAPDLVSPFAAAIRREAPQGSVAALSMRTIIYPAFPSINYTGASWSLRHNSLWFLPGLYADQDARSGGPLVAHPLDRMPGIERMFFDQIVDDLCATPPRLLAVESAGAAAPAGRRALDLIAYYSQSPRAARLLSAYAPDGTVGPFTLYTAASTACSP
jgi:hypothetical protein